ncbi:MAG: sialidase family protein, partial [Blastocatellia bacterium]
LEGDATVRNENPPKVAVSPTGDVYACWANERAKWKGDIRFARSTDKGKTFSRAITLNSDGGEKPAGHAFQAIDVGRDGRVYVTWIDERNKGAGDRGAEIWLASSSDRGKTFSRDRRVLSDVCECCRTNIQIDSAGRLFLSYRTVPSSGPMYRDIIVARSDDAGKTFQTTRVSSDGWDVNACPVTGPALCIDSRDRVTVLWFSGDERGPGLYFTTSIDSGKSYAPRKRLDQGQKLGKHAQGTALADGRLLVAWDQAADGVASGPASIAGYLDVNRGTFINTITEADVAYPTLATNGAVAVMAGMTLAAKEIRLINSPLTRVR